MQAQQQQQQQQQRQQQQQQQRIASAQKVIQNVGPSDKCLYSADILIRSLENKWTLDFHFFSINIETLGGRIPCTVQLLLETSLCSRKTVLRSHLNNNLMVSAKGWVSTNNNSKTNRKLLIPLADTIKFPLINSSACGKGGGGTKAACNRHAEKKYKNPTTALTTPNNQPQQLLQTTSHSNNSK
ncbi:unnamed protein product [Polarella glacialis]|uniref:Uncharacterized protein n=1 Tax=Polarella glacialis TaxID=89957 RepID=A0A813JXR1_POLGL|nr:unnamed protein product [Polarella glacialis]